MKTTRNVRSRLTALLLWSYAAVSVGPLLIMLMNSFRTPADLYTGNFLPRSLTLDGYVNAWNRASFGTYFFNSMLITVSAVTLTCLVAVPAAYALARWKFRGRSVLEALFISGLMIPVMVAVLPLFFLVDTLGLIDNPLSLVFIYATNGVPFSIFVLSAFFRQLPGELDEAARVDGAGHLRTFWSVMLPLVKPALATVIVFRFVPIWNDFLFPLVLMRSKANYTVSVGLTAFFGEYATDWSVLFAGLVIATLPLIVLFVLATKQIVAGLTAGIGK